MANETYRVVALDTDFNEMVVLADGLTQDAADELLRKYSHGVMSEKEAA